MATVYESRKELLSIADAWLASLDESIDDGRTLQQIDKDALAVNAVRCLYVIAEAVNDLSEEAS